MKSFGPRAKYKLKHLVLLLATTIFIVVALSSGIWLLSKLSSRVNYRDLSPSQLQEAGYYAYVLPKQIEDKHNWKKRISMISFDYQCTASDYLWNPVTIVYGNDLEDNFRVEIFYAGNPLFDDTAQTTTIPIDVEWIPSRNARYYVSAYGETKLKILDLLDNEVVIRSNMNIGVLVQLISKLEYEGPDVSTVDNPWLEYCAR